MEINTTPSRQRMDAIDRSLLSLLQSDASRSYADLATQVGLSPGAVHERVRKLRDREVIRHTTVEVDPAAVGKPVLSLVTVKASEWMGDRDTAEALAAIDEIEEAHIIAGAGSVSLKIRTASPRHLQDVLRRLFAIPGVNATETTVVLETLFSRPVSIDEHDTAP